MPSFPGHDSINLQLSGYFNPSLGFRFALEHPDLPVAHIPFVHHSRIGHALPGQLGEVHCVLQDAKRFAAAALAFYSGGKDKSQH